jgi:hypothetical protein
VRALIAKKSVKQAVDLAVFGIQGFLVEAAEKGETKEERLRARSDALRYVRKEIRRWGMPLGSLLVFGTGKGLLVVRRNSAKIVPISELEKTGDLVTYETILDHVLEVSKMKHLEEFLR